MLPPEIAKQIRLLEIRTNRVVDEITGGAYRSVFKGRGIEFDEVREYTPEDDVRDIDWNVSARMGAPYVKKYMEERELTVLLLVDVSASGAFGSAEKTKRRDGGGARRAARFQRRPQRRQSRIADVQRPDRTFRAAPVGPPPHAAADPGDARV